MAKHSTTTDSGAPDVGTVLAAWARNRPAWMKDGACAEHPGALWFPAAGQSAAPALAICRRCLVVDECLAYAVANRIEDGVWGATSGRQRLAMFRSAARDARGAVGSSHDHAGEEDPSSASGRCRTSPAGCVPDGFFAGGAS